MAERKSNRLYSRRPLVRVLRAEEIITPDGTSFEFEVVGSCSEEIANLCCDLVNQELERNRVQSYGFSGRENSLWVSPGPQRKRRPSEINNEFPS